MQGSREHLLRQHPAQFLALGGDLIDRVLHLGEDALHLVDIAGQRIPPGVQRSVCCWSSRARAVPEAAATIPARRSPASSSKPAVTRVPPAANPTQFMVSDSTISGVAEKSFTGWESGTTTIVSPSARTAVTGSVHPVSP